MTKLAAAHKECKQAKRFGVDELKETLCQTWHGSKGETYEIKFTAPTKALCTRYDSGRKSFNMWVDESHNILWWGTNCAYWADLADLRADKSQVSWFSGTDWKKSTKARFVWWVKDEVKVGSRQHAKVVVAEKEKVSSQGPEDDSSKQWNHWKPALWKEAAPQNAPVAATKRSQAASWKAVVPKHTSVEATKHSEETSPPCEDTPPVLSQELAPPCEELPPGFIEPPPGLEAFGRYPIIAGKDFFELDDITQVEEDDTTASSECSDSDKDASSHRGSADLSLSHASDEEQHCCDHGTQNQRPPEPPEMPMTKLAFMAVAPACPSAMQYQ